MTHAEKKERKKALARGRYQQMIRMKRLAEVLGSVDRTDWKLRATSIAIHGRFDALATDFPSMYRHAETSHEAWNSCGSSSDARMEKIKRTNLPKGNYQSNTTIINGNFVVGVNESVASNKSSTMTLNIKPSLPPHIPPPMHQ